MSRGNRRSKTVATPSKETSIVAAPVRLIRLSRFAVASLVVLAVVCLLAPAAGAAQFGIERAVVSLNNPDGTFSRQAGAHADFNTSFDFNYDTESGIALANPKDVSVALPPGLLANPTAVPTCPLVLFTQPGAIEGNCPTETRIGFAYAEIFGHEPGGGFPQFIYNLPHPPDSPALFGFRVVNVPVFIKAQVDPANFGVTGLSINTSQANAVFGADLTFWGVPADHGTGAPRRAFFSNPTSCPGTTNSFTFSANSWQVPDVVDTKTVTADPNGAPFINEGCNKLLFEPSMTVVPGSHQAATPTGLTVDIKVPQNDDPDSYVTPQVKKTVVTFPKGVAISASAANGLTSCSLAQIGLGSNEPPTCPDASKIGTVTVKSPLLEEELHGNVILAKQNDNPFPNPSLLALYMVVKGPGFYLKFPGKTELDPNTGQVTTTFDNTPQLPFEDLKLSLDSGPRAALSTPETCGTYTTHVEMTSWASSKPVSIEAPFKIDEGCNTGGFDPGLRAGVSNTVAGNYAPFLLQVTRNDGEQNISRIQTTLPPGVVAKLAGVPLCPESAIAAGACPAASKVGTVTVGAGVGANPTYIPEAGRPPSSIYLAGPYKGTAYSLIVQVPAQAGPLDVGVVNSRVSLNIDPITTQVTTISDPLPQILEGIPITYRDIRVEINRPEFTLNPTNCSKFKVASAITSAQGKVANPSDRFQMSACGELDFSPKLEIAVKGGTRRGSFQKLKAVLTQPKGQANIAKVSVALPHSEFLAQEHIRTVCTRVQFAAENCPPGSIYGKAKVISPLLDKAEEGLVYLRSSSNPLPDLVIALRGQIDVNVAGRIDSVNGGIRNTFAAIPDVPVSKFTLEMQGGKKSLLVNSTNLCAAPNKATVKIDGQNGKSADQNPVVGNSCGKSRKSSKHHKR